MSTKKAAESLAEGVGSVTGSSEKVERIREIIFGAQLREYAQTFEGIQHDLSRLNREVERLQEQLREQEVNFKKQLREEAERLARQLQEQEQQQSARLAEASKQQAQELQRIDQKHSDRGQDLGALIQANIREVANRLHELSAQINHAKVDRSILGDLLVELGTRLHTQVAAAPVSVEDDLINRLSEELE